MAEITAKVGRKADDSKADKSKIAKGQKPDQKPGAEGQYPQWYNAICGYCHANNLVLGDTDFYVGFYCWNCGSYNVV